MKKFEILKIKAETWREAAKICDEVVEKYLETIPDETDGRVVALRLFAWNARKTAEDLEAEMRKEEANA